MHYRGPIGSCILFRRFDAMVADARQSDGGNRASQRAFFDELPRSFAAEDRKEVVVDVIGPHQRKGSRWGRKRERWRAESSAVISAGKWPRKGRGGGEKRLPREACVW